MTDTASFSFHDFKALLADPGFPDFGALERICVAVSGGPDSLALAHLLARWSEETNGPDIHVVTVDHGLRAESAQEAAYVGEVVQGWPRAVHEVLCWEDDKPDSRLQEEAREARYALIGKYCAAHDIDYVFLAHHRDDQAETFLFRLSKGSGLDGLACMQGVQERGSVSLVRPLLSVSKQGLVEYCEACGVDFVRDPSNESERFARVRLRRSMEVLSEEGLSSERLARTSQRLSRARQALDFYAMKTYQAGVLFCDPVRIVLDFCEVRKEPEDIVFRVVSLALKSFQNDANFGPRMTRVEALVSDALREEVFRKRTLGGVTILRDDEKGHLIFEKEGA